MTRTAILACLLATAGLTTACTQSVVNATKPRAIETAQTRAHYDLACQKPKGTVVAATPVPPTVAPPPQLFTPDATDRARFDVAISGCGTTRTVPVMCSQEIGCFAGAPA